MFFIQFTIVLVVISGVLFDVFVLALARGLMRKLERYDPSLTGVGYLLLSIALPSIFMAASVSAFFMETKDKLFFWVVGTSNAPAVLAISAFLALAMSLLANQVFWPMISRPIYALQRFGIIENKKVLWLTSLAVIGLAAPWFASTLRRIARQLGF